MAGRSANSGNSKWVKDEPEVIEFDLTDEGYPSKSLVLTKDLILKSTGAVTGNLYVWNGAGSVVDVDERDIPAFLNRPRPKSCCGSVPTPYFVLLEG